MPRRDAYVPTHRGPAPEPALKKGIRTSFIFSGVAVAATGIAVSSGILAQQDAAGSSAASLSAVASDPVAIAEKLQAGQADVTDLPGRERSVSRSDRRDAEPDAKDLALDQESGGQATRTEDLRSADPRDIARQLLPKYGFSESQFSCLDSLYMSESGWNPHADNPSSTAYGIPQALTGGTHDNLPADYMTNPASQIEWGLDYIRSSYGTPCSAWSFKQGHGWY